ncbi:serine/threonine protein kinase ppk15, putative [Entamoeba histolytica HM-3:IMSS]|uniref:Protein kinase, putative n=6 Tax=Entamoeba histolytica TaxID=5759 RepID=C4LYZ2_ENTH1|nr:protein kinase, putative [Entamoeba histolytica HM-1:IMSS]EMD42706.1 serine/threonine protein kinase ppk15, putative [Entamoeba histolytica KU27]EMS15670.1 serine/threonine protein kinase ppk15, putative [Entamoeba histolytica HM-3:IMSS]ENY63378.1 serine/threonine protein kinase ppk15, putative [Entamoeba histolytica HM-1:IMSS-A]GAT94059.1 protein kinase putative [Entamoeba histolytica]EAL50664.1 protein kinase, putative [Entamoeba histolytica HM-1:IMSS]|eukprot:XP_656048.1 protein kinase, putative [Entamoeba histolytica HM-1:IMSS]
MNFFSKKSSSAFTSYFSNEEEGLHSPNKKYLTKYLTSKIFDVFYHCSPRLTDPTTGMSPLYLTAPSIPRHNSNYDNENYDLIVKLNDVLGSATSFEGPYYSANPDTVSRYKITDRLGQGMFGQVFKARDLMKNKDVAIKVLRSKFSYFRQGMLEVAMLSLLNDAYDKDGSSNTVRLVDHFLYHSHLCIVTELLGKNLYQAIQARNYKGFPVNIIRNYMKSLLQCLSVLEDASIVHCDVKPENMLIDPVSKKVRVIDFGSACFSTYTLYTYIQSRHYRAPEVILGLPYSCGIDVWSAGCICAELILGIPLFPGSSEYNELYKITDMLGQPPDYILEQGTTTQNFYNKMPTVGGRIKYIFKQPFEYEMENAVELEPDKRYFRYRTLDELIMRIPMKLSDNPLEDKGSVSETRQSMLHFIHGLLQYDPESRWTAKQALDHPFITQAPFTKNWQPKPRKVKPVKPSLISGIEFQKRCFPGLKLSHRLNTQEYYDIFTASLQKGEVVNISSSNPFQLGPMTPSSFREVYAIKSKTSPSPINSGSFSRRSCLVKTPGPKPPNMTNSPFTSFINSPRGMYMSPSLRINSRGDYDDDVSAMSFCRSKFSSAVPMKQKTKMDYGGMSVNMGFLPSTGHGQEKEVVKGVPPEANIPIIPVPIRRNEPEQEPGTTEYAPVFIFDDL